MNLKYYISWRNIMMLLFKIFFFTSANIHSAKIKAKINKLFNTQITFRTTDLNENK